MIANIYKCIGTINILDETKGERRMAKEVGRLAMLELKSKSKSNKIFHFSMRS